MIRERLPTITLHPSFNRKFRNPFTSKASWQIEECIRALQCHLPMVFRPLQRGNKLEDVLQPALAKKTFGHLKRFAAFHLGHVGYATHAEYVAAAKSAQEELLEYGKLVEQVRGLLQSFACTLLGNLCSIVQTSLGCACKASALGRRLHVPAGDGAWTPRRYPGLHASSSSRMGRGLVYK